MGPQPFRLFSMAVFGIMIFIITSASCAPARSSQRGRDLALSRNSIFGVHFPNGTQAVEYAYGPEGMWKEAKPIEFNWNYYQQYSTEAHPFDREQLIRHSNGAHFTSAPDANGHLLFDLNHEGTLPSGAGGFAFHEHNGRGRNGEKLTSPFTQFWFDDNYLARFMSQAYGKIEPGGLSEYPDFTRWRILSGDPSSWSPYHQNAPDQLALDGFFYSFSGESSLALESWKELMKIANPTWSEKSLQFDYPGIRENYHLGLFKILNDRLMDVPDYSASTHRELVQHSISLRSALLTHQQSANGTKAGWTSSIDDPESLMNIESLSVNVLALGTDVLWSFEVGLPPLGGVKPDLYPSESHILSMKKVRGKKGQGTDFEPEFITSGPHSRFPVGKYQLELFLRSPLPVGKVMSVSIYDRLSNTLLASKEILAEEMESDHCWTQVSLPWEVLQRENLIDFQIFWPGESDVDFSVIRIRRAGLF